MLHLTMIDASTQAANDLIAAFKTPTPAAPFQSLTTAHHKALQQLADIFNTAAIPNTEPTLYLKKSIVPRVEAEDNKIQQTKLLRVISEQNSPLVTTSSNPMTPDSFYTQPKWPHSYKTRSNNLIVIPPDQPHHLSLHQHDPITFIPTKPHQRSPCFCSHHIIPVKTANFLAHNEWTKSQLALDVLNPKTGAAQPYE
eukprot:4825973-Ditylum_brightwellii.AAC.1